MNTYTFEKSEVWKDAIAFAKFMYLTTANFSGTENYGLVSEIRTASIAISSNIAKASAKQTYKEKEHLITMAYTSSVDVLSQLVICFELNFIPESDYLESRKKLIGITSKLKVIRNYYTNRAKKEVIT